MKFLCLIFALLASTAPAIAQVSITDFGTGQFTDAGSDTTSYSQSGSAVTVSMSNTGFLYGTVPSVNISGNTTSLLLTATVTTNPGGTFTLELLNSTQSGQSALYNGNWGNFTTGSPSTITLTFGSAPGGFDYTTINQVFLSNGGGPSSSVSVTLDQLSAIPEPSTYAAIFGLACLGVAIVRRQKRQALAVGAKS